MWRMIVVMMNGRIDIEERGLEKKKIGEKREE